MRTLTVALVAATGLMTVIAVGASAAGASNAPVQLAQAAVPQQAQYYPDYWRYRHYRDWDYYRPHHRHWRGYDRWRYSEAEELNHQELQRLGVAP